ncbi:MULTISPECIES: Hsp70 family protein [unclassified Streptomyces]|uniref:Hsp70 family protein n=1 Tax=unclassified Streptomyces TaxID=2593676 RepID=UPI00365A1776
MTQDSARASDKVKVAAAVDFGTYGTGFAWSVIDWKNESPESREIRYPSYRSAGGMTRSKNLSAVLTTSDGEVAEWGHRARDRWQRHVSGRDAGWGYVTGYKMALRADNGELAVTQASGRAEVSSIDAVRTLVVGVLSMVRSAAEKDMAASGYLSDEVRWCLTVPAIWDEEDKQFMRDAAVRAGFPADDDRLLLVIEPEAAAITGFLGLGTLIDGSGRTDQVPLAKAGTRLMVVDCGGGTIDITAYESLRDDQIRLGEIGKVCGGRLGSEFLNHAFRTELLADRLGFDIASRLAGEYPEELQRMDDQWEKYKLGDILTVRDSDGKLRFDESARVSVDVPGEIWELLTEERRKELEEVSGRRYRLTYSAADAQKVFDRLIDPILDRVEEQLTAVEATPAMAGDGGVPYECMLLVGGFSASGYLRDRVHDRFGGRIRVLRPPNHEYAVLEGAVHYAYNPDMMVSRRARYTYGVEMIMPWEESDGPERRKDIYGEPKCEGRFRLLVTRGRPVEMDEGAKMSFSPAYRNTRNVHLRFYRTTAKQPRYVTEGGCERIGSIAVDVPVQHRKKSNEYDFTLRVYFGGTEIKVEAVDDLTGQVTPGTITFDRMH